MKQSTWHNKHRSPWVALIVGVAVTVAAYFGNVELQALLGRRALSDTGLTFHSLPNALQEASTTGKPVLVDFSAIWCPTCRALHTQVFSDPQVKRAINAHFVLARVDYDATDSKAFMQRYAVTGFPSLLVLDGHGNLLRRLPVVLEPSRFATELFPSP